MMLYHSVVGAPIAGSLSWPIRLILAMLNMGGGGWQLHAEHAPISTEPLESAMSAFTPDRRLARFVAFGGG